MGSLGNRLRRLEERARAEMEEGSLAERRRAYKEFLKRLTHEELAWLCEPGKEAQSRVPCPHVEMIECGCRGVERERRGFEAHPELYEEYLRRRKSLLERAEEILRREPEDPGESWRRRNGFAPGRPEREEGLRKQERS